MKTTDSPINVNGTEIEATTIEPEDGGKSNDTSLKCVFGKLEFNVGESLDLEEDKCQKCICKTPPMLHCIETC